MLVQDFFLPEIPYVSSAQHEYIFLCMYHCQMRQDRAVPTLHRKIKFFPHLPISQILANKPTAVENLFPLFCIPTPRDEIGTRREIKHTFVQALSSCQAPTGTALNPRAEERGWGQLIAPLPVHALTCAPRQVFTQETEKEKTPSPG